MVRHVIIGGGPAGIAAAEAIRREDTRAELRLVCDDPYGYYSRPGLAYYLTGEIPEEMLTHSVNRICASCVCTSPTAEPPGSIPWRAWLSSRMVRPWIMTAC